MMERTLVIIKPDAQERGLIGRIISRFEDKYLRIVGMAMLQKDEAWVKEFYPHLLNPVIDPTGDILKNMIELMTSVPLIGMILAEDKAVQIVRALVGECLYNDPGTIRGDFATLPVRYNCVHASDSVENAEKEIALFFGEQE